MSAKLPLVMIIILLAFVLLIAVLLPCAFSKYLNITYIAPGRDFGLYRTAEISAHLIDRLKSKLTSL